MLFHEIYSSYYLVTAGILREAVQGTLTGKKLNAIVQRHAFGESLLTIPEGLAGEKWRLLHRDLTTPLQEEPSMPLTDLEKRWMKALLLDPRIRLFEPDMTGLNDVEPLFTPDMIVYYDRYSDGDDYDDPSYIRHFHTILKALCENRDLFIRYESRLRTPMELTVTPHYLEYSEKDDCFRLFASDDRRSWTIRLSRLSYCAIAGDSRNLPPQPTKSETLVFELEDTRNALERVLLHFSHLEKETVRLSENRYRVSLRYDTSDETEMLIRILSFGPVIRVTEPQHFAELLRERIERQRELNAHAAGQ